ncbi:MAG: hypothetical protein EXX96DRAFT_652737 [Benjaminiella poitrasii]|nr:MAG: hypothetical protein EXX96DRAFT_652737 [Benjaminiella poitrasii]
MKHHFKRGTRESTKNSTQTFILASFQIAKRGRNDRGTLYRTNCHFPPSLRPQHNNTEKERKKQRRPNHQDQRRPNTPTKASPAKSDQRRPRHPPPKAPGAQSERAPTAPTPTAPPSPTRRGGDAQWNQPDSTGSGPYPHNPCPSSCRYRERGTRYRVKVHSFEERT